MQGADNPAVLFADVGESTRLYEAAGDAEALEAIGSCLDIVRRAVEASAGTVVKTSGACVMALFERADEAAEASTRIHVYVGSLAPVAGEKLGLRIGFHVGPVIRHGADVFGDTVNVAARIVEYAVKGQVLMSEHAAAGLAPFHQVATRRLYDVTLRGKADELALCEYLWRASPDVTDLAGVELVPPRELRLRLCYRGRNLTPQQAREGITIGRSPACQLVVREPRASRAHCVIERRMDKYFLRDHSTNGTYVAFDGEPEMVLRREEMMLGKHGWITFGQPRADTVDIVEYFCE
jgi:adenylate cyclase